MRPDAEIAADVEAGLRLHGIIEFADAALKDVAARLKADALACPGQHEPLHESEREGRRWLAPGGLTIILTADSLRSEIERNGPEHLKMIASIGADIRTKNPAADTATATDLVAETFAKLAKPWAGFARTERDGLAFRTLASTLIAEPFATEVIAAWKAVDKFGVPKSDVKAEWDSLANDRAMASAKKQIEKDIKLAAKAAKKGAA